MSKYLVGKFKGKKTTHLFTGFVYENPICKREPWRRFPKAAIVFPVKAVPVTCPVCKKLEKGE